MPIYEKWPRRQTCSCQYAVLKRGRKRQLATFRPVFAASQILIKIPNKIKGEQTKSKGRILNDDGNDMNSQMSLNVA